MQWRLATACAGALAALAASAGPAPAVPGPAPSGPVAPASAARVDTPMSDYDPVPQGVLGPEARRTVRAVPASVRARAESQCQQAAWGPLPRDATQAQAIMAGRFELGDYGVMRVRPNPNWRNQGSLDSSGNGHQNSLHWALPLLRVGVATGNSAMVSRFYYLIKDWVRDNPPRKPRNGAAYGQIETGYRLLTMTCALAGPMGNQPWVFKALRSQGMIASRRWAAINNASFHHAAGVFAAGCATASGRLITKGLAWMNSITSRMVNADGSVNEGALSYARSTYAWTSQEAARIIACGGNPPSAFDRVRNIPAFLAQAVRPDSKYEALGDGGTDTAQAADAPGTPLEYAASGGAAGPKPEGVYSVFPAAGFVFGRSGWGVNQPFTAETFYSLRTGPGSPSVYHAHSDAASLTVAAAGGQLLFDSGQYRYANDAASRFIRSREAHNVVLVSGRRAKAPAPRIAFSDSSPSGDLTTIVDRAYGDPVITRSVWYDRKGEFFVVVDHTTMARTRKVSQNWNLGRDRTVDATAAAAHTSGKGPNVSLFFIGEPAGVSVVSGGTSPWRGWNSRVYGQLVPSPSVHVDQNGADVLRATVIVPRLPGQHADQAAATGVVAGESADITVTIKGTAYRVLVSPTSVTRLDPAAAPAPSSSATPTDSASPSSSATPTP